MDDPVKYAVVAWANHFQFGRREVVTNQEVGSRALVWVEAGAGRLAVGGDRLSLDPGMCVLLPWGHQITYHADSRDPFLVGAVHLIPWHDPEAEVEFEVAPGRTHRLGGVAWRRDTPWPLLDGITGRPFTAEPHLLELANWAVAHFEGGTVNSRSARALAALLVNELEALAAGGTAHGGWPSAPASMMRMQDFISSHLDRALSVGEVAGSVSISESTAQRLFRSHTGTSVGRWITERRLARAGRLLRTTSLTVAQVAAASGFDDPSYFSRAFRRANGLPPAAYAARNRLL